MLSILEYFQMGAHVGITLYININIRMLIAILHTIGDKATAADNDLR